VPQYPVGSRSSVRCGVNAGRFRRLESSGEGLNFDHNGLLPAIVFDVLTSIGDDLRIEHQDSLASIGLANLKTVEGDLVIVKDNPVLPTCQAEAMVAQLDEFTGTVTISDNNDSASCQ
jgi:hypothetical protein